MRILITGGSGFIGSVLSPRLVAEGHQLFCVCRPGSVTSIGERINWDAARELPKSEFPATIDAVIHLAQSRAFRQFPADAPEMFDINVRMTWSLLQWAVNVGARQFILASTGAVYEPFDGELNENAVLAPTGFLGATKLASEILARAYASSLKLSVLRLFFPYGPGQKDRLIPNLIRRVRMGQTIQLTQDGVGLRFPPAFVDDIASIFTVCLREMWTGTFNVASSEMVSISQVVEQIGKELGIAPIYERLDQSILKIHPNIDRLAERFDLKRFTRFEEGLRKTIAGSAQ